MTYSPDLNKDIQNAIVEMGQLMEGFEVKVAWNMHSKCVDKEDIC